MRIKKFFKIIVSILMLLSISYWGYKYVNKTSSLVGVIHKDADAVIKIDLHSIRETLVLDALSSPKYYYQNISLSSDKKDKEKDSIQEKGIDLNPYSIVMYTLKNIENTVFTTLPIKNVTDFNTYAKRYLKDKNAAIETAGNYQYAVLEKSKIIIGWSPTHLAIAASPGKITFAKISTFFKDVLTDTKLITDKNNTLIQSLKNTNDQIAFLKGNNLIGLNFTDGELKIKGQLEAENAAASNNEINIQKITDASFQLYLDYGVVDEDYKSGLISTFKNNSFLQKSNLDISSISNYSNGFISLAVNGKTTQKDTILSYSYDDNFNKIEEKRVQEKETPKIYLNLGTKKEGLQSYLKTQRAVKDDIFVALPYYKFYVSSADKTTLFSTTTDFAEAKNVTSKNLLECNMDFAKLNKDISFPNSSLIFNLLNTLELSASLVNEHKITLQGVVTAKKEDVNIITQLFFGIENAEKQK